MTRSSRGIERSPRLSVAARLFITVWIVYSIHFASNVVRETYLAIALGEKFSVRVDDYVGLHPDLFEIPGKGAYINSNPGASMLGALPYTVARPVIDGILRARPELARPKPAAGPLIASIGGLRLGARLALADFTWRSHMPLAGSRRASSAETGP